MERPKTRREAAEAFHIATSEAIERVEVSFRAHLVRNSIGLFTLYAVAMAAFALIAERLF
jgi:hypothetical protein